MPVLLLVEDNPMNRKLMRDMLDLDFEIIEAVDAEQALELIQQSFPDLILMDLQLPGMDGLTLTRHLQADPATRSIPIVAVSAHAMQQSIDEARQAGCVEYITKPILDDPDVLVQRLNSILTNHSNPDAQ